MSGRILVVDDCHANLKLIERWLTGAGYDGLTADSGENATLVPSGLQTGVHRPEMELWTTPGSRALVHHQRAHRLREAEVQHLHGAVGAYLHVRGLEVAVDDALFVRRGRGGCRRSGPWSDGALNGHSTFSSFDPACDERGPAPRNSN